MEYLLTIYRDEQQRAKLSEEESKRIMDAYWAFGDEAEAAGVLVATHGLQPTSTATTVRVRDGERILTDGPFAETKEQLAGYYLLDCKDLDQAIEFAAKVPGAAVGSVEVRPVMVYERESAPQPQSEEATA